jgi:hypothetical protein
MVVATLGDLDGHMPISIRPATPRSGRPSTWDERCQPFVRITTAEEVLAAGQQHFGVIRRTATSSVRAPGFSPCARRSSLRRATATTVHL